MTMLRRLLVAMSVHVYAALLWLYPPEFRARFRTQMVGAFSDACNEQVVERGVARGAMLWAREVWGLVRTSAGERLDRWRSGSRSGSGRWRFQRL